MGKPRKTADELWAAHTSILQVGRLDAHVCGRFALKPKLYKNGPQHPSVKRFRIDTLDANGREMLREFLIAQKIAHVIMSAHAAKAPPPDYDKNEAQEEMFG